MGMLVLRIIHLVIFLKEEHKFKQAMKIKNPKNRLKKILDACKNKTKCEGGDDIDEVQNKDTDEPVKKSRGGCGAQQPKLTIEGMKMIAEYKIPRKKTDEPDQLPEPAERKQTLGADRVRPFFQMNFAYCCFGGNLMACEILAGFECFKED